MNTNRRIFIKNTAVAAAAVSVAPAVLNACASPAEKVTVALIGCRSMGFNDLV
ncbi:MAG: twin-arginine translocation signal domain-containing protein, partial [Bacteroidia bacterium]|nr:twin-arginine translocation signal domain-containing protein [Bacteroidia bacterium]